MDSGKYWREHISDRRSWHRSISNQYKVMKGHIWFDRMDSPRLLSSLKKCLLVEIECVHSNTLPDIFSEIINNSATDFMLTREKNGRWMRFVFSYLNYLCVCIDIVQYVWCVISSIMHLHLVALIKFDSSSIGSKVREQLPGSGSRVFKSF